MAQTRQANERGVWRSRHGCGSTGTEQYLDETAGSRQGPTQAGAVAPGAVLRKIARFPGGQQRGFTLVEVIIGCVIVALMFLTFVPAYLSSEQAIRRGQNKELATQSARQELESWRLQGYVAVSALIGAQSSRTLSFTPSNSLPQVTGQDTFTRVDTNLLPVSTESGRIRVAATVAWNRSNTDSGSVTLTTLFTDKGEQ